MVSLGWVVVGGSQILWGASDGSKFKDHWRFRHLPIGNRRYSRLATCATERFDALVSIVVLLFLAIYFPSRKCLKSFKRVRDSARRCRVICGSAIQDEL